jgi:lipoate-protein ligase B
MKRTLTHVRLKSPIHYATAGQLQDVIVRKLLDAKLSVDRNSEGQPPAFPAVVMTMEMRPVYTTGRRERGLMSDADKRRLGDGGRVSVIEALRGGQTTFHGLGQLVAYPILDLTKIPSRPASTNPSSAISSLSRNVAASISPGHSLATIPHPHVRTGMSARCYVHALEESIIRTLLRYGIRSMRTENTGVWTSRSHKIAAIGVHLRRGITSHGIALNVSTDLTFFDNIVACGLPPESIKTTSIEQYFSQLTVQQQQKRLGIERVATDYVEELASVLGYHDVQNMELHDLGRSLGLDFGVS